MTVKKPSRELIVFIVSAIIIVGIVSTWPYFATERQIEIIGYQKRINHTLIHIETELDDIKMLLNSTDTN